MDSQLESTPVCSNCTSFPRTANSRQLQSPRIVPRFHGQPTRVDSSVLELYLISTDSQLASTPEPSNCTSFPWTANSSRLQCARIVPHFHGQPTRVNSRALELYLVSMDSQLESTPVCSNCTSFPRTANSRQLQSPRIVPRFHGQPTRVDSSVLELYLISTDSQLASTPEPSNCTSFPWTANSSRLQCARIVPHFHGQPTRVNSRALELYLVSMDSQLESTPVCSNCTSFPRTANSRQLQSPRIVPRFHGQPTRVDSSVLELYLISTDSQLASTPEPSNCTSFPWTANSSRLQCARIVPHFHGQPTRVNSRALELYLVSMDSQLESTPVCSNCTSFPRTANSRQLQSPRIVPRFHGQPTRVDSSVLELYLISTDSQLASTPEPSNCTSFPWTANSSRLQCARIVPHFHGQPTRVNSRALELYLVSMDSQLESTPVCSNCTSFPRTANSRQLQSPRIVPRFHGQPTRVDSSVLELYLISTDSQLASTPEPSNCTSFPWTANSSRLQCARIVPHFHGQPTRVNSRALELYLVSMDSQLESTPVCSNCTSFPRTANSRQLQSPRIVPRFHGQPTRVDSSVLELYLISTDSQLASTPEPSNCTSFPWTANSSRLQCARIVPHFHGQPTRVNSRALECHFL
ncbi:UNVERIFIED_CONTAM: hypothetical protein FKN15_002062 [Acipenser sinensis]